MKEVKNRKWLVTSIALLVVCYINLPLFFSPTTSPYLSAVNYAVMLFVILWTVWTLWYYKLKLSGQYAYTTLFACVIVLCVIAAYTEYRNFRAGFVHSFVQQAWWYLPVILYMPLSGLLRTGVITTRQVTKAVCVAAVLQLAVQIVQYFVFDTVQFMYVPTAMRYNGLRLYFQTVSLSLLLFICLNRFYHGKNRWLCALIIVAVMFDFIVVQKYRMTTLAACLTIGVSVFLMRGFSARKLLVLLLGAAACVALLQTQIIKDTIETIRSGGDTLSGRAIFREYLLSAIWGQPMGFGSVTTVAARSFATGPLAGVHWVFYYGDHGIFGFLYMYGIPGFIWLLCFFAKQYKMAWQLYRKKECYTYLLFLLMLTIQLPSEIHWYEYRGFIVWVVFVCMLEQDWREMRQDLTPGDA